jgi:hypothetical protein
MIFVTIWLDLYHKLDTKGSVFNIFLFFAAADANIHDDVRVLNSKFEY